MRTGNRGRGEWGAIYDGAMSSVATQMMHRASITREQTISTNLKTPLVPDLEPVSSN